MTLITLITTRPTPPASFPQVIHSCG